jgi:hypothetical protein
MLTPNPPLAFIETLASDRRTAPFHHHDRESLLHRIAQRLAAIGRWDGIRFPAGIARPA